MNSEDNVYDQVWNNIMTYRRAPSVSLAHPLQLSCLAYNTLVSYMCKIVNFESPCYYAQMFLCLY